MDKMNNIDTKNTTSIGKEILQWVGMILIALLIALVIRGFIFEPVIVKGPSMQNTLFDGQRLFIYKLGSYFSAPKKGDIIVLQHQAGVFESSKTLDETPGFRRFFPDFGETNYIKRVIGTSGDKVDIRDGAVYVNDKKISEPYAKGITDTLGMTFPISVPENKVFVLGDNRENSSDSRQIGFISLNRIKGKAVFRIYPFNVFGRLGG